MKWNYLMLGLSIAFVLILTFYLGGVWGCGNAGGVMNKYECVLLPDAEILPACQFEGKTYIQKGGNWTVNLSQLGYLNESA